MGCLMPEVIIYTAQANKRSVLIAEMMMRGAISRGIDAVVQSSRSFTGKPDARVALFYGLSEGLYSAFRAYRDTSGCRVVFVDLGYWARHKLTRWDGYHKIVLGDRHPTAYFQGKPRPADRIAEHKLEIKPWRKSGDGHIIIAGMSAKAAAAEGFAAESWERETAARLSALTDRRIIYRPKPNWSGAKPIKGTVMDSRTPLDVALRDAYAVVTHHSNVAIDALIAGVPCVCPFGAASVLSAHSIEQINNLPMHGDRAQFAADLAYTQYSIDEMQSGIAWDYVLGDLLEGK
jgi:hypothetical protein